MSCLRLAGTIRGQTYARRTRKLTISSERLRARPIMVIVDVRPEATLGIPTDAYFGVEEIKDVRILLDGFERI